jgi:hypothetical protein
MQKGFLKEKSLNIPRFYLHSKEINQANHKELKTLWLNFALSIDCCSFYSLTSDLNATGITRMQCGTVYAHFWKVLCLNN